MQITSLILVDIHFFIKIVQKKFANNTECQNIFQCLAHNSVEKITVGQNGKKFNKT